MLQIIALRQGHQHAIEKNLRIMIYKKFQTMPHADISYMW